MNSNVIRWSFVAIVGLSAAAASTASPGDAQAAWKLGHPDFLWNPVRVQESNRLYVGGLQVYSSD